jgi:hypothetical protein
VAILIALSSTLILCVLPARNAIAADPVIG